MKYIGILFFSFFTISSIFGQNFDVFDKNSSSLPDDEIISIAVDKKNNTWIGTSKNGFFIYNGKDYTPFKKEFFELLKGDYISPLFIDSKERVWLSYSNPEDGILMFNGSSWSSFSKKELDNIDVVAIAEDSNGKIYFGGINNVITYDGNKWEKIKLPKKEIIVRSLNISSNGKIAIGHNEGLLIFDNNKWIEYTEENSELILSTVRAVKFLNEDELYVGYGGGLGDGGFSILKNKLWKHFNKKNSKVSDHMVRDIEVDKKGNIWMATNYGLLKLNDNEITPIFFNNGKFTNVIMDIYINDEDIWLATTIGVIKYNPYK